MSRASQLIRDSIAALPEGIRQHPWDSDYGFVLSSRYGTGGEVVADCLPGHLVAPGEQKETSRYIGLFASPHVAAAVADLLDAIDRHAEEGPAPADVQSAVDALEAAITRKAAQ